MLKSIEEYLQRFKSFVPKESLFIKKVQTILQEETGVFIAPDRIRIASGTIFVEVPGALKNEIFFKKESILEKAKKVSGGRKIKDIR